MNLSDQTLEVIKNYSKISSEMVFRQGNFQSTMTSGGDLFAITRLSDEIPQDFCIYDINELLGVLSMFKDDLKVEFTKTTMVITGKGGKSKVNYRMTAPNMISMKLPSQEVFDKKLGSLAKKASFHLTEENLKWTVKNSQILKSTTIKIAGDGKEVVVTNFCSENDSAPSQSLSIDAVDVTFAANYSTERFMLLLADDYQVHFAPSGVLTLIGQKKGITYYMSPTKGTVE